jgi:hypothetical protein
MDGWQIGLVWGGLMDLTFGRIEAVLLSKAFRPGPTA